MPGYDRTGPQGSGPMTGRGLGPCGRGFGFRRGFGRGFGGGFGRGFGFWDYSEPASLSLSDQKKILEAELSEIDAEKKQILKKLSELKDSK